MSDVFYFCRFKTTVVNRFRANYLFIILLLIKEIVFQSVVIPTDRLYTSVMDQPSDPKPCPKLIKTLT